MSNNNEGGDALAKLHETLGFNCTSKRPDSGVLANALVEVKKKRTEGLQKQAEAVIEKAMEVAKKWDSIKKEFAKEEKKMAKELGKILNSINAMNNGQPTVDTEENTNEDANE